MAARKVASRRSKPDALALQGDAVATQPSHADDRAAGSVEWLTRTEVAAILRVSIATVRRLEGLQLHPRRSETGFYMFDPREVETARAQRPAPPEPRDCRDAGELAAEAFRLLRDGIDIRDLVIALRRPPREVEVLHADWQRMGESIVISPRTRSELSRLAYHDLISDEMLDAIEGDDADTLSDLVDAIV
jgi:hypothetical protein